MKKTLRSLLPVAAIILLIAACTKDKVDYDPQPSATGASKKGLRQLFSPLRPLMQTFNVNAGTQTTITGAMGTRLTFYPNSFRTAGGQTVSSGSVQIQLMEATKPGSMIGMRAATVGANGALLRSGGEVYIKATMNGQELSANKYGISFKQAAYSSQLMALFVGNNNNEDSVVTWDGPGTGTGTTSGSTTIDSTQGTGFYHQFDSCTAFNWINCDYFYNSSSALTNVDAVTPDTSFNGSNTSVFMVFPSINSVTYLGSYAAGTHTFSLYTSYYVPVGMNVHIIGISSKNGNLYYSELLNQSTTSGMSVNLSLQQQTLSYIQSHLAAL